MLVSINRASELLAISPRTVRRLVARGDLPAVRIGRAVRIPLASVHSYIDRALGNNAGCGAVQGRSVWQDAKTKTASIVVPIRPIGGRVTSTRMDAELDALLAPLTDAKPKQSSVAGKPRLIARDNGEKSRPTRSRS